MRRPAPHSTWWHRVTHREMTLDSGERVWVVHHVVDWTHPATFTGTSRFAKNKNADDLQGEGVRAFAMDQLPDGSVASYDLPAKVRREQPEPEGGLRNATTFDAAPIERPALTSTPGNRRSRILVGGPLAVRS